MSPTWKYQTASIEARTRSIGGQAEAQNRGRTADAKVGATGRNTATASPPPPPALQHGLSGFAGTVLDTQTQGPKLACLGRCDRSGGPPPLPGPELRAAWPGAGGPMTSVEHGGQGCCSWGVPRETPPGHSRRGVATEACCRRVNRRLQPRKRSRHGSKCSTRHSLSPRLGCCENAERQSHVSRRAMTVLELQSWLEPHSWTHMQGLDTWMPDRQTGFNLVTFPQNQALAGLPSGKASFSPADWVSATDKRPHLSSML